MYEKKLTPQKTVTYAVLCIWALTTIYPFIWVILNSFKQKGLIISDSFSGLFYGHLHIFVRIKHIY